MYKAIVARMNTNPTNAYPVLHPLIIFLCNLVKSRGFFLKYPQGHSRGILPPSTSLSIPTESSSLLLIASRSILPRRTLSLLSPHSMRPDQSPYPCATIFPSSINDLYGYTYLNQKLKIRSPCLQIVET